MKAKTSLKQPLRAARLVGIKNIQTTSVDALCASEDCGPAFDLDHFHYAKSITSRLWRARADDNMQ